MIFHRRAGSTLRIIVNKGAALDPVATKHLIDAVVERILRMYKEGVLGGRG